MKIESYWHLHINDLHLTALLGEAIDEAEGYSTEELLGLIEDLVSAIRRLTEKVEKLEKEKKS